MIAAPDSTSRPPLRLWPGVAAASLLVLIRYVAPVVSAEALFFGIMGGLLGAVVIALWWLLFSRARWYERIGALVVIVAALAVTSRLVDKSIANGMMGMMLPLYAIPAVSVALVVWAVATRHVTAAGPRIATLIAAIAIASGFFTLLRTDGILGERGSQLTWRWTPTHEEQLLAQADEAPIPIAGPNTAAGSESAASPAATAPTGASSDTTTAGAASAGTTGPSRPATGESTAVRSDATPVSRRDASQGATGVRATTGTGAVGGTAAGSDAGAGGSAGAGGTTPGSGAARGATAPGSAPATATAGSGAAGSASASADAVAGTAAAGTRAAADWPGFRGPERNGIVRGVRIDTDWTASPPVRMWRRDIGPGWSSFAVHGDLLYTQEQRGEEELVACYRVSTGDPVWWHRDRARFWESNGGAGPRATPTLSRGRVYAFGATGILNALDARTGALLWSRNVAADTDRQVPDWGFASSPLVIDDLVIVAASGTLAGYDAATGKPRWVGPKQRGSYSSPHRATIDGVPQILLLSGSGAASVAPKDGTLLWAHEWEGGTTIVQPALTTEGDVLINGIASTGGIGTRRLAIAHDAGGWHVAERWTSNGLKPYFNDFVINKGYAFGFDGSILAAIDLADGTRAWKGGRYGNGQLILLPEQDLLLVLSEDGELALVRATPDRYQEVARVPALEGKTWNHPVLIGDILLVRNDHEMAAFRLSRAGVETASR